MDIHWSVTTMLQSLPAVTIHPLVPLSESVPTGLGLGTAASGSGSMQLQEALVAAVANSSSSSGSSDGTLSSSSAQSSGEGSSVVGGARAESAAAVALQAVVRAWVAHQVTWLAALVAKPRHRCSCCQSQHCSSVVRAEGSSSSGNDDGTAWLPVLPGTLMHVALPGYECSVLLSMESVQQAVQGTLDQRGLPRLIHAIGPASLSSSMVSATQDVVCAQGSASQATAAAGLQQQQQQGMVGARLAAGSAFSVRAGASEVSTLAPATPGAAATSSSPQASTACKLGKAVPFAPPRYRSGHPAIAPYTVTSMAAGLGLEGAGGGPAGGLARELQAGTPSVLSSMATGAAAPTAAVAAAAAAVSWLSPQLDDCWRRLAPVLHGRLAAAVSGLGAPRCGGVLLTGPHGSGRSAALRALAAVATAQPSGPTHCLFVSCTLLAAAAAAGRDPNSPASAAGGPVAPTRILSELMQQAMDCQPSLIILDDLDALAPSAQQGAEPGTPQSDDVAAAALASWLAEVLDALAACGAAVAWAASAAEPAALAAALRAAGRFDAEVRLPALGAPARAALLAAALARRGLHVSDAPGDAAGHAGPNSASGSGGDAPSLLGRDASLGAGAAEALASAPDASAAAAAVLPPAAGLTPDALARVVALAEGCDASDLDVVVDRALHAATARALRAHVLHAPASPHPTHTPARPGGRGPVVTLEECDLREALQGFIPASFWGVAGGPRGGGPSPGAIEGWPDVGGLSEARHAVSEALELPFKYAALVAAAPLRLRTGLLLYGPPGCGKTHIVAAAAAAMAGQVSMRWVWEGVEGHLSLGRFILSCRTVLLTGNCALVDLGVALLFCCPCGYSAEGSVPSSLLWAKHF